MTCTQRLSYCEAIYIYFSVRLNITLKCLWFFPRHAPNATVALCGVGVDGTQLSRPRPPPLLHPHSMHTQHTRAGTSCWPSSEAASALLSASHQAHQSWFETSELLPAARPRNAIHGGGLPGMASPLCCFGRHLGCLAQLLNSCTVFPPFVYHFLPPKQTKVAMSELVLFMCPLARSTNDLDGCGDALWGPMTDHTK